MVAGRRLPLPVLIGTLFASWVGGGTVTGTANLYYTRGPLVGIIDSLMPIMGVCYGKSNRNCD